MKKYTLLALLIFMITPAFASVTMPHPKHTKPNPNLPAFSTINVKGFVNVIIQGTTSKSPKATTILSRSRGVNVKIRQHTLYISTQQMASHSRKPATVKVRMYRLNKLSVYGRSSVTAKNIKSDGLFLRSDTVRNITLNGSLTVNRILNYASNRIKIRWVNGKAISIQSGAGIITLAGSVSELRVKLRNHAKLDAKYLRAQRVLVQVKGFAIAKVLPIQKPSCFRNRF